MTPDSLASYESALRAIRGGGTPAEMQARVIAEYLAEHPGAQAADINVTVTETITETMRRSNSMTIPNEQKPDLSEMFDLNRHKAVNGYVDRFEELLRQKDAIQNDIKEVSAEASTEGMFSPVEVDCMKIIAKWRVKDKNNAAAEKLAALRRISNAVKVDLFSWADKHRAD